MSDAVAIGGGGHGEAADDGRGLPGGSGLARAALAAARAAWASLPRPLVARDVACAFAVSRAAGISRQVQEILVKGRRYVDPQTPLFLSPHAATSAICIGLGLGGSAITLVGPHAGLEALAWGARQAAGRGTAAVIVAADGDPERGWHAAAVVVMAATGLAATSSVSFVGYACSSADDRVTATRVAVRVLTRVQPVLLLHSLSTADEHNVAMALRSIGGMVHASAVPSGDLAYTSIAWLARGMPDGRRDPIGLIVAPDFGTVAFAGVRASPGGLGTAERAWIS